jgi:hypothetical protein
VGKFCQLRFDLPTSASGYGLLTQAQAVGDQRVSAKLMKAMT